MYMRDACGTTDGQTLHWAHTPVRVWDRPQQRYYQVHFHTPLDRDAKAHFKQYGDFNMVRAHDHEALQMNRYSGARKRSSSTITVKMSKTLRKINVHTKNTNA